jgi:hypothetical protein
MKIAREVTVEDLTALRAYLKTRPEGRGQRRWEYMAILFFTSFLGAGVMAIPFAPWTARTPLWFAVSPVLGLLLSVPTWRYLDGRTDSRFVAANLAELGHQEFWIAEDGFGNSTPAGSTFHKWVTVSAVEETPALGFILGGIHLYAIPVAGARGEVAEFIAALRERLAASKSEVPPNNEMQLTTHG